MDALPREETVREALRGLGIPELAGALEFCGLPGDYVNMESLLPDGSRGKLLQDDRTYLCCQVPAAGGDCYGVAADERRLVVYRYGEDGADARVVRVAELAPGETGRA